METQESKPQTTPNRKLAKSAALDRMLDMMQLWWEGRSMADIGRAYGISRQRVGSILAKVGCTAALRRMADHERPDSKRRGWRHGADRACVALLHPLARRLTIRQRAALAWQAQGLALPDIARRMRATSQNVRGLQVAGHWRLERLTKRGMPKDGIDIGMIEWAEVVRDIETARSSGPRNGRNSPEDLSPRP